MNSKSDKTLADKELIPPQQPRILAEIETLMRKPNINLRVIANLISQDPILTGVFLRTINSSYYGLNIKIESAEQAIPMIGLQQTLNIIRAEALKRATGGGNQALAHSRLHERAQKIAQLSTIIAERYLQEYLSPEIVYLVGQFHDCGVPILMQHYPSYCAALNLQSNNKLPKLLEEDRSIGMNHCEVGYRLAKDWKLPTSVCAAIRYHHDLGQADEDTRGYVAALQMAMHLYNLMSNNDDSEWEANRTAVIQEMEIEPEDLGDFESSVQDKFREQTREI